MLHSAIIFLVGWHVLVVKPLSYPWLNSRIWDHCSRTTQDSTNQEQFLTSQEDETVINFP